MTTRPSDTSAVVGENLKQARLRAGMTQTDVADKLGVAYQQIQKYESNTSRITVDALVLYAEAVGVSPADVLPGTSADKPATDDECDRQIMNTSRAMRKLPYKARLSIVHVANTMAENLNANGGHDGA